MNGPLEWYAALAGIVAAAMIAGDFGRRISGLGFVIFVTASIAWIAAGLLAGTMPLAVQNGVLLVINLYGVWQFWLSPKNKKKLEAAEQAAEKV